MRKVLALGLLVLFGTLALSLPAGPAKACNPDIQVCN